MIEEYTNFSNMLNITILEAKILEHIDNIMTEREEQTGYYPDYFAIPFGGSWFICDFLTGKITKVLSLVSFVPVK